MTSLVRYRCCVQSVEIVLLRVHQHKQSAPYNALLNLAGRRGHTEIIRSSRTTAHRTKSPNSDGYNGCPGWQKTPQADRIGERLLLRSVTTANNRAIGVAYLVDCLAITNQPATPLFFNFPNTTFSYNSIAGTWH